LEEYGKDMIFRIVDASAAVQRCKTTIAEAREIPGVNVRHLGNWQLQYNDYIHDLKDTLAEMLEAVDECCGG
jgi:hypothetical protein